MDFPAIQPGIKTKEKKCSLQLKCWDRKHLMLCCGRGSTLWHLIGSAILPVEEGREWRGAPLFSLDLIGKRLFFAKETGYGPCHRLRVIMVLGPGWQCSHKLEEFWSWEREKIRPQSRAVASSNHSWCAWVPQWKPRDTLSGYQWQRSGSQRELSANT